MARGPSQRDHALRQAATRGIPGWIWLSGGLLLGAVVAVALFFQDQPSNKSRAKASGKSSSAVAPGQAGEKAAADEDEGFRFDFFEILSGGDQTEPAPQPTARAEPARPVKPAVEPTKKPATRPASKPAASGGTRYWLQAGAFRDPGQADQLKAKLLLSGLPVRVVSGRSSKQQLWHRVRIGPYRSEAELKQPKARLQRQKIQAIVVKTRG